MNHAFALFDKAHAQSGAIDAAKDIHVFPNTYQRDKWVKAGPGREPARTVFRTRDYGHVQWLMGLDMLPGVQAVLHATKRATITEHLEDGEKTGIEEAFATAYIIENIDRFDASDVDLVRKHIIEPGLSFDPEAFTLPDTMPIRIGERLKATFDEVQPVIDFIDRHMDEPQFVHDYEYGQNMHAVAAA
jgi:hypothetical protein